MATVRINIYGIFIISVSLLTFILFWLTSRRSVLNINSPVVSLRRLLASSISLAEEAGAKIVDIYKGNQLDVHKKLSNEPLTIADLQSNSIIIGRLFKAIPGLMIRSEEVSKFDDWKSILPLSDYNQDVSEIIQNRDMFVNLDDLTVWVDPLDATQEFTEGLTDYVTVLICIAYKKEPIIGIVNQPFLNETYWSWKSFGNSPSIQKLIQPQPKDFPEGSTIRIVMSRSHVTDEVKNNLKSLLKPYDVEIISHGGSAFKVLELLKNNADLYIHPTSSRKWDICAPNAIINSLDGFMLYMNFPDKNIDYSAKSSKDIDRTEGFWATPHSELHQVLKDKMSAIIKALT